MKIHKIQIDHPNFDPERAEIQVNWIKIQLSTVSENSSKSFFQVQSTRIARIDFKPLSSSYLIDIEEEKPRTFNDLLEKVKNEVDILQRNINFPKEMKDISQGKRVDIWYAWALFYNHLLFMQEKGFNFDKIFERDSKKLIQG